MDHDEGLPPLDLERSYGIAPLVAGPGMSRAEYGAWLEEALWRPSRVPGLEVAGDVAPAAWIAERLFPGTFQVRMTVPDAFEAYARIFYNFYDGDEPITWTQLALRNGRVAHALMEQETISVGLDGTPASLYGSCALGDHQYEALALILARHTESQRAWFLMWDGFGGVDPRPFEGQAMVEHQWRSYHPFRGPLSAFAGFNNSHYPPSYFWPDDRAWCLCTDIDFAWAYLAGTVSCVDEVTAATTVDAYRTLATNPARAGMDTINDPTGRIQRGR